MTFVRPWLTLATLLFGPSEESRSYPRVAFSPNKTARTSPLTQVPAASSTFFLLEEKTTTKRTLNCAHLLLAPAYGAIDCPYPLQLNFDADQSGLTEPSSLCVLPCPNPQYSTAEYNGTVSFN